MATSSVVSKSYGAGASQRFLCEGALEAFGIPFVYYGTDGSREYTSPAGEALLRSDRVGATLAAQADHAAKELCWSHARVRAPAGHLGLVRELPCCSDDGIVLALHMSVSASGRFGVVVVIRPSCTGTAPLPALGLTRREAEVARLIAGGLTTKAIASLLGITTHTTRHHTERVFDKLGVHTRASLAALLSGYSSGGVGPQFHASLNDGADFACDLSPAASLLQRDRIWPQTVSG